jgi:hypothetical protein
MHPPPTDPTSGSDVDGHEIRHGDDGEPCTCGAEVPDDWAAAFATPAADLLTAAAPPGPAGGATANLIPSLVPVG